MAKARNPRSHPLKKQIDRNSKPYGGPFVCDARPVASLLVYLSPGATRGMIQAQSGVDEVIRELKVAVPGHGRQAGLHPDVFQSVLDATADIARLTPVVNLAASLAEIGRVSLIAIEDRREKTIRQIADVVDSAVKQARSNKLLAPFRKTLEYRGRAAKKAAATRERKRRGKPGA